MSDSGKLRVVMKTWQGKQEQGRGNIMYATLREERSGDIVVSAHLDYCLRAIRNRGYILVKGE